MLVPFGSPHLYGLERTVIELFDILRPEVDPEFLLSKHIVDQGLPVVKEVRRRRFRESFLPDEGGWPWIGKPKSPTHAWRMFVALVKGNYSTFRASLRNDVLYLASPISYYSLLAAVYCKVVHKRVVFHLHDCLPRWSPQLRMWELVTDDFVHYTAVQRAIVTRTNPFIERRSNWVIPISADAATGTQLGEISSQFRHYRNIVFMGQVSKHKGIDLLIQAFKIIAPNYPDTMLHIIGGCSQHFATELQQLLNSAEKVKVWGYRENAVDLLRGAFLYVHPSPPSRFQEAFGRGVVEAMALGIPCVCFRSGALQEIVVNEETGLVCDESVACLGEALKRFLDDEAFRKACGTRAQLRYEEQYSRGSIRNRWLEMFQDNHKKKGRMSSLV